MKRKNMNFVKENGNGYIDLPNYPFSKSYLQMVAGAESESEEINNLIILDESGSMMSIYNAALSGTNETLQTIYTATKENPDLKQFVTLVTFSSNAKECKAHLKREKVNRPLEMRKEQYKPYGCTALYDTIGLCVNKLRHSLPRKSKVLVTIITDGMENSSTHYSGKDIENLISELKSEGWVFTYIGANQDAQKVAKSINIDFSLNFEASEEGMKQMWEKENLSRKNFYKKMANKTWSKDDEFFEN